MNLPHHTEGDHNLIKYCACGQPLHYENDALRQTVENIIAITSPDALIVTGDREWLVPKHYIALHRVTPELLPSLKFPEVLPNHKMLLSYRHDDGAHLVDLHHQDYTDQIFDYLDDDGRDYHFVIRKLRSLIDQAQLIETPIHPQHCEFIEQRRTIDETHIAERIDAAYLNEPGILCRFADGSFLVVDGNHRYVKRSRNGLADMQFWLFEEPVWRRSLVNSPSQP